MQAVADSAQQQAQRTAQVEQQLAVMREELATVGQRQVSDCRPPPSVCLCVCVCERERERER